MDKLFEDLVGAFGVSGHEGEVRDVIIEYLNSLEIENKVDKMGNVIATIGKKNQPEEKRTMIVSHMDTMGFIVLYIEENGFLRIGKIGEFDETAFVNTLVEFENGNSGRVCISKKSGTLEDMYIDLGVGSREEALELVQEGHVCAITSNIIEEEKNIIAPFLDNRVGCYMALKAIGRLQLEIDVLEGLNLDKEVFFVFSTQNVLGGRGARVAANSINPMYALVIDGEASGDSLGATGKLSLGKGTAVKFMDKTMLIHHEVKAQLEAVYEKLGKKPTYVFGEEYSDGRSIHKEGTGIKTGTMVYPVRYQNTNMEMVNYQDIQEGCDVIFNYILD